MSQTLESTIRTSLIALLISAAVAGQPARGAVNPACNPAMDAMLKQISTPTHVYASQALGPHGKPRAMELIYADGVIYMQIGGAWKRSPLSVQDMRKQEEENRRNAKSMDCRYLRDETVNGEAAAVYHLQAVTEADTKSDSTLWISKRTGLPLKSENDIDIGDPGSKQHLSTRYEYTGVRPPAGAK
jgi:hypothetical protein